MNIFNRGSKFTISVMRGADQSSLEEEDSVKNGVKDLINQSTHDRRVREAEEDMLEADEEE